jgi:dienelactone hydrolase
MRRVAFLLVTALLAFGGIVAAHAADTTVSQQVRFAGAGGVPLAGTLALPMDTTRPVPAMLLLQGSGPTDRDGNQPDSGIRTDLLRQVADILAAHGIASLRYDKRGMYANTATRPARQEDYPQFFSWQNFVGDALAAHAFLAGQPVVDAGRVGLLGHSEGGLIALQAADMLQQQGNVPAALVLAAAPGRPFGAIIEDQIRRALRLQQATPDQERFFLSANARVMKDIRMTGRVPGNVPPGLAPFYPSYAGPLLQPMLMLDPAKLARGYQGPVLVLQGASDVQISAEQDALALDRALQQRSPDRHTLLIAPGVSHNLKQVADSDSQPGFEGQVSDAIAAQLAEWLTARLQPAR